MRYILKGCVWVELGLGLGLRTLTLTLTLLNPSPKAVGVSLCPQQPLMCGASFILVNLEPQTNRHSAWAHNFSSVWHGKAATGHMVPAGARQDKRDADLQVRRPWFMG